MKKNWKQRTSFISHMAAVILSLHFFLTVFTPTYLNGFRANFIIDRFGEQHLEWFLLCLYMDLLLVGLYFHYKDFKGKNGKKEKKDKLKDKVK